MAESSRPLFPAKRTVILRLRWRKVPRVTRDRIGTPGGAAAALLGSPRMCERRRRTGRAAAIAAEMLEEEQEGSVVRKLSGLLVEGSPLGETPQMSPKGETAEETGSGGGASPDIIFADA